MIPHRPRINPNPIVLILQTRKSTHSRRAVYRRKIRKYDTEHRTQYNITTRKILEPNSFIP